MSLTLALLLGSGCGKRTPVTVAISETPEPAVVCPEPEPAPRPATPGQPLVYDSYVVELPTIQGDLYAEKHYTFVGPVVRVRVRYLSEPVGDIKQSSFSSCEAEIEAPIVWHEGGFTVASTVTAKGIRVNFERRELAPEAGERRANTNKDMRACWISLLAGDYWIDDQLDETIQGRTKGFTLTEPSGDIFQVRAASAATDSDLVNVVDDHFWR